MDGLGESCAYRAVSQSEFSVRLGRIVLRCRMRKLLLLILSSAMLIGGLYVATFVAVVCPHHFLSIYFRRDYFGVVGRLSHVADFIAPRFGIKTWEDNTPKP